jgi:hypothetical protein
LVVVGLVEAGRKPLPILVAVEVVAVRVLLTSHLPHHNSVHQKHIPLPRLFPVGVGLLQVPADQTGMAETTPRLQLGLGPQP